MITRRTFLYQSFGSLLLPTLPLFGSNQAKPLHQKTIWKKSLCPLCSIGCEIEVAFKDDPHNDPSIVLRRDGNSKRNFGIVCQKLYALSETNTKIPKKRITQPLLKMIDPNDPNVIEFQPISWDEAFVIMQKKSLQSLQKNGTNGIGVLFDGSNDLYESYALTKLFKGGFRSNNLTNYNFEVEQTALNLLQIYGIDGGNATLDTLYDADVVVSFGIDLAKQFILLQEILCDQKTTHPTKFTHFHIDSKRIPQGFFDSTPADFYLPIAPNTTPILFGYLLRSVLENLTSEQRKFFEKHAVFAILDLEKKDRNSDDSFHQWEILLDSFITSFDRYTLAYTLDKLYDGIGTQENLKAKLVALQKMFCDPNKKITTLLPQTKTDETKVIHILCEALHLTTQKFAQKGCGILILNEEILTSCTSLPVGNSSARLPMGMFTQFKQHQQKVESVWNLPPNTLNPISDLDPLCTLSNYQNNLTDMLWITTDNKELHHKIQTITTSKKEEGIDSFIVGSLALEDSIEPFFDLILPTATHFEKNRWFENFQRELLFSEQITKPIGLAKSLMWQVLEFSKSFTPAMIWREVKINNTTKLPSVLQKIDTFSYNSNDTLYTILFDNKKTKKNTTIEKYLFEVLRTLGSGVGYDYGSHQSYHQLTTKYQKWPIVFGKETPYRFTTLDDFYTTRGASSTDNYLFYGKMGSKRLPFGNNENILYTKQRELALRVKICTIKDID